MKSRRYFTVYTITTIYNDYEYKIHNILDEFWCYIYTLYLDDDYK